MKGVTMIDVSRAQDAGAALTFVELTWHKQRIENRIRFGRQVGQEILDRHRRVVSFAPSSIFAFVRWAANDFGTIISRVDVVRAVAAGERYQTLPFVRPGGEILLRMDGWPRSSACCRRSTRWRRWASIRPTPHQITGSTSTTGCP
jgi:hypothetical protein